MKRVMQYADVFYPSHPQHLENALYHYLQHDVDSICPKALIVPHAGFMYSGKVAGYGYRQLQQHHDVIKRIVILAPSHKKTLQTVTACSYEYLETPLGDISVDRTWCLGLPVDNDAHDSEYAIEVQLPFIKQVLPKASVVPLLLGHESDEVLNQILNKAWLDEESIILISSDLYHYVSPQQAPALGMNISNLIEDLSPDGVNWEQACGFIGVNNLLKVVCGNSGYAKSNIILDSSQAIKSHAQNVVGYGCFSFYKVPSNL